MTSELEAELAEMKEDLAARQRAYHRRWCTWHGRLWQRCKVMPYYALGLLIWPGVPIAAVAMILWLS